MLLLLLLYTSTCLAFPHMIPPGMSEQQLAAFVAQHLARHGQRQQASPAAAHAPLVQAHPHFQAGSALSHQQAIWSKVLAKSDSGQWPTAWQSLGLFTEDDHVTGDWHSDEFPPGRLKLIHSVGACALINYTTTSTAHPYTGLFASGAAYGFVRAASATQPGSGQMTPGFSLKFFRDNTESANFVALHTLQAQSSYNFFEAPGFANHVGSGGLSFAEGLLLDKFRTVSSQPGLVGLSDMAMVDERGQNASAVDFPFGVLLQTNPAFTAAFANSTSGDVPSTLSGQPAPSAHLSKVYAIASPAWPPTLTHIGNIFLTSEFRASAYADDGVFFRHIFIQHDWALKPAWKTAFEDPARKRWLDEGYDLYAKYLPPF